MEKLPNLRALNLRKNAIVHLDYKLKHKRNNKRNYQKEEDPENEPEPELKWENLQFLNLSFNRIIEITSFQPRKLRVQLF